MLKKNLKSVFTRGGHTQFFFESAIAIPQLERSTSAIAIPQLFKKCCSATATPQFRNRNFFQKSATSSPQLESFTSAIFGIFWAVEYLEMKYFLPTGVFLYWEDFKGAVARDFRPLFFPWINPIWTPESFFKRFLNSVSNSNTPNLGY